jgi:hypothetical protein
MSFAAGSPAGASSGGAAISSSGSILSFAVDPLGSLAATDPAAQMKSFTALLATLQDP